MRTKSSGIDQDMEMEDFMDMSLGELKNKVEIVRLFDKTCDDVREVFLEIINDFMIVEETVMVPKKVRRLERLFE
jgi:myo-inositol catabolism protein IolC